MRLTYKDAETINNLLKDREEARKRKDWALSDELRDFLLHTYNIEVIDHKDSQEPSNGFYHVISELRRRISYLEQKLFQRESFIEEKMKRFDDISQRLVRAERIIRDLEIRDKTNYRHII